MRQKSILAIFLWGVFFLFIYIPFCYSQQTQKKVEPSLSPQVPQKVLKQQSPAAPEQKGDAKRPKTILPDLTVVGGLRMARGPETGEIAGGGPHRGERWFAVLLHFDVENRGEAPAGRFENWLVSEGRVGMQSAGRGIKNSLRPHERKTYGASFLIPLEYAGRTVRIRAYVDPLNETTESDETNNSSDWFEVRLPALLPDLEVRILSTGSPRAENRNPSTGRLEGSGAPEHLIPVYVFIPFSVVVKNNGLAPARPIRVRMETQGHEAGYGSFWLEVPGSRSTGGLDIDASLGPGEERSFSGLLCPRRFSLPEYRSHLEGRRLRFRAEVDPVFSVSGGVPHVVELNETNNYSSWTGYFTMPRPTITLEEGVVSVPDLSITIDNIEIIDRSTYPDLDICTITITVRNNGTVASGNSSGVEIWLLEREGWNLRLWSDGFRSFAPGESLTYPFAENLAVSKTATKARAIIDSRHWTLEVDRSNNQAERDFPLRLEPYRPEVDIRR